jgi:protoporphyrinogen/coproporphyrinogen III oxidase
MSDNTTLNTHQPVIIIGAGITGLALGFLLKQKNVAFIILEKESRAGGIVLSHQQEGYLFDIGPHTALSDESVEQFIEQCGLKNELLFPQAVSDKRFVLRDNKLHELKPSPVNLVTTSLLSSKGKFRLFAEPFIPKRNNDSDESLHDFVKRRFGIEVADYLLNPFIAGIYAGRPEEMSAQAVFPKLVEMEAVHGSVVKAFRAEIKKNPKGTQRKVFSFKNGMQQLIQHLESLLQENIISQTEVAGINKHENYFTVNTIQTGQQINFKTQNIVFTAPAYSVSSMLKNLSQNISQLLAEIYYPPMLQVSVGYSKSQIGNPINSFGFLIPEKENKTFLGAIFQSSLFPNRSPNGKESFTLYIGGARNSNLFNQMSNDEIIKKALTEFQSVMKIKGEPEIIFSHKWEHAIPQYKLGYTKVLKEFSKFEKQNPGIHFAGNYIGGVGIANCIKKAIELSKLIA